MNRFYRALEAKYQADIEEALAVVDLYFNKPVGVGEHPDILTELDKYMGLLESSMGKLEILKKIFNQPEKDVGTPEVSDK